MLITLFMKSVFIGYSMKAFNEVRDILDLNHVRYKYEVRNSQEISLGSRMGRSGINKGSIIQYEIFVSKKNYDEAAYLIKGINPNK